MSAALEIVYEVPSDLPEFIADLLRERFGAEPGDRFLLQPHGHPRLALVRQIEDGMVDVFAPITQYLDVVSGREALEGQRSPSSLAPQSPPWSERPRLVK